MLTEPEIVEKIDPGDGPKAMNMAVLSVPAAVEKTGFDHAPFSRIRNTGPERLTVIHDWV